MKKKPWLEIERGRGRNLSKSTRIRTYVIWLNVRSVKSLGTMVRRLVTTPQENGGPQTTRSTRENEAREHTNEKSTH